MAAGEYICFKLCASLDQGLAYHSRVTSTVGNVEPDKSEARNKAEGGEAQKIEVHPCSSIEDQDDGEVDETK